MRAIFSTAYFPPIGWVAAALQHAEQAGVAIELQRTREEDEKGITQRAGHTEVAMELQRTREEDEEEITQRAGHTEVAMELQRTREDDEEGIAQCAGHTEVAMELQRTREEDEEGIAQRAEQMGGAMELQRTREEDEGWGAQHNGYTEVAMELQRTREEVEGGIARHTGQKERILIEAMETFPKQTYRNRTEIMTAGGMRTLTVPVIRENHSRTEEVKIDYKERWNIIHLRTLTAAYSASPYFLYYKDELEALLMPHYEKLMDLNEALLSWVFKLLKTQCHIRRTQDYQKEYPLDFRNTFSPKHPYPTDNFPPYYQVFSDRYPFVPNLSILDALFNLGPETRDYLMALGEKLITK